MRVLIFLQDESQETNIYKEPLAILYYKDNLFVKGGRVEFVGSNPIKEDIKQELAGIKSNFLLENKLINIASQASKGLYVTSIPIIRTKRQRHNKTYVVKSLLEVFEYVYVKKYSPTEKELEEFRLKFGVREVFKFGI